MFSDNGKITQNQLKRQLLLGLIGSFLFVQSELPQFYAREGFLGILICFPVVLMYLRLLVRVSSAYQNPEKLLGRAGAWILLLPYYLFLALSGSFFLRHTAGMVQKYLLPGMGRNVISLLLLLTSFLGTGTKLQGKARMAQAAAPLVLGGFVIMTAAAAFSVNPAHLRQTGALEPVRIWNGAEGFFSACMLLSLQPFVLNRTEEKEKSFQTLAQGLSVLTLLFLALLWVLVGTFGYQGLMRQETPVLKLMSGVLLPGKFLERFDIIWMGVLLFSLLYLSGSLLFYGEHIGGLLHKKGGAVLLLPLMYAGALWEAGGKNIGDYYGALMRHFGIPVLVLLPVLLLFFERKHGKKLGIIVLFFLLLTGCGAVEPEKRAYPLCIAIDWRENRYEVIYGMANLAESTGQEKEKESAKKEERLSYAFSGKTFAQIERVYEESQEYYLDLGHVQAVILGKTLLGEKERLMEALDYLEQEPLIGRTAGVFSCADIRAVMKKNDSLPDSLGVYLNGIYKNRPDEKKPVSLEEIFYSIYNKRKFPDLPAVLVEGEEIRLKKIE